nr:hypothetical protein [uncultured Flavobacterium sp.]
MKSIYLKAGKAQDVFNDLKDNFNGTLVSDNDQFNLAVSSNIAKGDIKGIAFPDGMTFMQVEMVFYDDVRMSMESLSCSPIFFIYCVEGTIQHSFGEQGERKIIKKQQQGILKSNCSVNSILHFERRIPTKFYVIEIGTSGHIHNEQNTELIEKLKNTFFHTKEDYLDISFQNFQIAEKIEALNTMNHKGLIRSLITNRILENILELEIDHHTDVFSQIAQNINSFALNKIDEIKRASNFVMDISLQLFTTDFIIQKAVLFSSNLQKELKLLFTRSVHDFLIYIRVERERI